MADVDLASLLMSEEPSEQEQSRALIDALRRKQATGLLGVLTGRKPLADAGAAMMDDARHGMAEQAPGQKLARALQLSGLQRASTQEAEATAPANSLYQALARKFGYQLPEGMNTRQAQAALEMAEKAYAADMRAKELSLTREAMRGRQVQEAGEKHSKDIEDAVQKLGKDTEETAVTVNDIGQLTKSAKEEDIPGFGPVEGLFPDWAPSIFYGGDEGVKNRQAAKRVMAAILKKQSGTAVSEGEKKDALSARGLNYTASPDRYRQGLASMTSEAEGVFRRSEAKYPHEAVEVLGRRGGTTSADIAPLKNAAKAAAADKSAGSGTAKASTSIPAGKIHVQNPSTGEELYVDAGDLQSAQADGFKVVK
jgi:hypothetical protein